MKTKTTIQLSVVILALMLILGFRIDSENSMQFNSEYVMQNTTAAYNKGSVENVILISENIETNMLKHETPTPFVGFRPIQKINPANFQE